MTWHPLSFRIKSVVFQLTSSRRGWQMPQSQRVYADYFNSHPHEEDDLSGLLNISGQIISTHILTKRMTRQAQHWTRQINFNSHPHEEDDTTWRRIHLMTQQFQLTSSRRGWPRGSSSGITQITFQLTSSRRGWQLKGDRFDHAFVFQLTSSRRGWQSLNSRYKLLKYFNSHPHEEDDSLKILIPG